MSPLKINEIFKSIQGEGPNVGTPMTFVRLQGCNLRRPCTYCDTKYAYGDGGNLVDSRVLAKALRDHGLPMVCITGGEPLQQDLEDLIVDLRVAHGLAIEIETNGTLPPPPWHAMVRTWCVDVKCPSSGAYSVCIDQWLQVLDDWSAIKFVVGNEADLAYVNSFLKGHSMACKAYLSPVMPSSVEFLQRVWAYCVDHDLYFNLQIHKVVWGNMRGV